MASISKRGDYQFQVIVRRKGYPTQKKTFESRAEAQMWALDVESKMTQSLFRDRRELTVTTLGQALTRYRQCITPLKRGHAKETQRIKQLLHHSLSLRSLDSLQAKDFAAYRDERLRQVCGTTVRLELALLSHLYTTAIKEWSLPLAHELKNVRKPSANAARERRLENDEWDRLLAAIHRPPCRSTKQDAKARSTAVWLDACVWLGLETGMRAGEILTLEWSQVNVEKGCIRLQITKNGSRRTVGLSHRAVEVLKKLPRTGMRVISNFFDTSGMDRAFKRACIAAGIADLRFHDLRHECASIFAKFMNIQGLAKIMGWKTLQMAMRYYHPSDDEMVELVRSAAPKPLLAA